MNESYDSILNEILHHKLQFYHLLHVLLHIQNQHL